MSETADHPVDQALTAPTVVATWMDDLDQDRLTDDIAREIFPYDDIARRYSLTDDQLIAFVKIPAINKLIRRKRAAWNSDGNAVDKLRNLVAIGVIDSVPDMIAMMTDDKINSATRSDLFKTCARIVGADVHEKGAQPGSAAPGTQFNVQIVFANGETATISADTAAQVIEGQAA